MKITIRRPEEKDSSQIKDVFIAAISDAFREDGIGDDQEGILEQIEKQVSCLKDDFDSNGQDTYYLVAVVKNKIVGTIAYQWIKPEDTFFTTNLKMDVSGVPEITSVYVLPDFQEKGIGTLLFNAILLILKGKNIPRICMDGGYQKSIQFWVRKIGHPDTILKDHWGKGLDQVFWYRKIEDINIQYTKT